MLCYNLAQKIRPLLLNLRERQGPVSVYISTHVVILLFQPYHDFPFFGH